MEQISIKPTEVEVTNTSNLKLGQWFHVLGYGYVICTMRGNVVVDTESELQEEINEMNSYDYFQGVA